MLDVGWWMVVRAFSVERRKTWYALLGTKYAICRPNSTIEHLTSNI
jgi:hypothetical protein